MERKAGVEGTFTTIHVLPLTQKWQNASSDLHLYLLPPVCRLLREFRINSDLSPRQNLNLL